MKCSLTGVRTRTCRCGEACGYWEFQADDEQASNQRQTSARHFTEIGRVEAERPVVVEDFGRWADAVKRRSNATPEGAASFIRATCSPEPADN